MSVFSSLIKELRLSKNMSLRSAANLIGISYTYLSNLEKGFDKSSGNINKPTPETLKMIASAYSIDYSYLLQLWGYVQKDDLMLPPKVHEIIKNCRLLSEKELDAIIEFSDFLVHKHTGNNPDTRLSKICEQ